MSPPAGALTNFFPPKPAYLEKDIQDLSGKVYIVSGSSGGVGKEVAKILYLKNARIYIAARSEEKAKKAMTEIKASAPTSKGSLVFLPLDLNDLSTIKTSVARFLAAEPKLHVLWNNAGVMAVKEPMTKTVQGYESNLGVNCLGTFLFTKLLTPILIATAKSEPPSTVRAVWVSSSGTELNGEKHVGLPLDNLDYHIKKGGMVRYPLSKAGNWLHGVEFAKRYKAEGVVSVPLNPGNLITELAREHRPIMQKMFSLICYPPKQGAYTELFAGLSPAITIAETGCWVIPWGRISRIREDLVAATKTEAEGGNGNAHKFWEWAEEQVKPYI